MTIRIGEGYLYYRKFERQTDRYGSFSLDHKECITLNLAAFAHLAGRTGQLKATILDEVKEPQHVGDWGRNISPQPLASGTVVFLGEGELFSKRTIFSVSLLVCIPMTAVSTIGWTLTQ